MCVCAHSSSWSTKVVECSKPSSDFFIDLFCNTHMCVCAHSSNLLANHQLTSSATHMCVCSQQQLVCKSLFNAQILQVFFLEPHMCVLTAAIVVTLMSCIQKHTCVCPQQQLVGYKGGTLTWRFLQHTCVCAHSSTWSAKNVECSKPSNDFFIDLFCNTHMCVCSQQQLVGQPSIDFFCNTHVCVLTAAVGLPKFVEGSKPPIDLFCTTHVYMCVLTAAIVVTLIWFIQKHTRVCPQLQLVGQPLTLGCNPHLTHSAKHMCVCSQQQLVCQSRWMFKAFKWLLHWLILQHTHVCVCSQQQLVGQPSIDFFCNTHVCVLTAAVGLPKFVECFHLFCTTHVYMCVLTAAIVVTLIWFIQKHTRVCPQLQLVGQPLTLGCSPTYSATHMCVCAHSSNWSAKVVECSKPSSDFFIDLFCNTHVCARSSNWSVNPQLTSSATHMCVCSQQQLVCKSFFNAQNLQVLFLHHICVCSQQQLSWPSIDLFKHTCVCPQQQLVGYKGGTLTWRFLQHTCVCAHSSTWSAKNVECSKPSNDFFIDLFCNTHMCVCSQQQLVGQPSIDFFCNKHVCVLTAAVGLPKFVEGSKPPIDLFCTTHVYMCVCSQQQLSWPSFDLFRNTHVYAHSCNWSANPWPLGATLTWLILQNTCVCAHSSNWPAKVVECSKLSNDSFIDLFCNTHMCVCSQQQLVGQPSVDFFCNTHVCVLTAAVGLPKFVECFDLFCTTHVYMRVLTAAIVVTLIWFIQKHTRVCPQLQLVGQPLTLGCSPTYSATHMCVCAHSSSWSAKVVECSKPSSDFFIDLFCNTHVCARSSNWSVNPQVTSSATHMCVCSQQQLVCKSFSNAQSLQEIFLHHTCVCSEQQWSWPSFEFFRNTHVYAHSSNWSGNPWPLGAALTSHILQHTCVCAHSSNWSAKVGLGNPQLISSATHMSVCSAKVFRMLKTSKIFCTTHVCVYSCNCRDPHLTYSDTHTRTCHVYSETHMCMPTAAIGRPTLDPWVQPSLDLLCKWLLHWLILQVLTAAIGRPTLDQGQKPP